MGTGCTTTFFENCAFLGQGDGQVPNDTYYVYLGGCAQPVLTRCTFEGLSPTTKPWVRLFGSQDPVFDCCWFENDPPTNTTTPTYFINLAGAGRGGAIRHSTFIRGDKCRGHMSILNAESGACHGLQILNPGGGSGAAAWNSGSNSYNGPPHIDLGGDSNPGIVVSGAGSFNDVGARRQLQIVNAPRAAAFAGRALDRLAGTTSTELFDQNSDDPARKQPGNVVMNWDIPGTGSTVGAPMYRWGGTDSNPQWRLMNNAPSLTAAQRDARSNWVEGDFILVLDNNGVAAPQVRCNGTWRTVQLN